MKTFSTSGTGSQQTLSEIESNKIPIYNSVTDAEADLANLEEGQIIGTKDEGSELSAPVDVVQSGNMHAVTSNAVAGALSYSTTEQLTGGIYDGKPVYRKLFILTSSMANYDLFSIPSLDCFINGGGFGIFPNDMKFPLYYTSATGGTALSLREIESNGVRLYVAYPNNDIIKAGSKIWIEYTKTTD